MYSHVMVGANDIQESKTFYDATLAVLGYNPGVIDEKGRCFYISKTGVFAITKPIDGEPATHANGGTIGFAAKDQAQVDKWHEVGLANGGTVCEGGAGIREGAGQQLYIAYLRDPAGNKMCALYRVEK